MKPGIETYEKQDASFSPEACDRHGGHTTVAQDTSSCSAFNQTLSTRFQGQHTVERNCTMQSWCQEARQRNSKSAGSRKKKIEARIPLSHGTFFFLLTYFIYLEVTIMEKVLHHWFTHEKAPRA